MSVRRPYLSSPLPLAIAHRGGSLERPENTMVAFEGAVRLGYGYLETDAQLTRDGVVLAFHDEILDRVTDLHGRVGDHTLEELRGADAGYHFSLDGGRSHPLRGTGVTVPTLEEVLLAWPSVRFNIDAKTEEVVAPLAKLIDRLRVADRVCIGSFSDSRLRRFRRLSRGEVSTSMGRRAVGAARLASLVGTMPASGADCVQVPCTRRGVRIVDRSFIRAARRGGLQVHVWTIDDRAEMERLLDLGVDGIMSDRPALLREVMVSRGLWQEASGEAMEGGVRPQEAEGRAGGQRDSNPRPPGPQPGTLTS